jgi:hypothetical protein
VLFRRNVPVLFRERERQVVCFAKEQPRAGSLYLLMDLIMKKPSKRIWELGGVVCSSVVPRNKQLAEATFCSHPRKVHRPRRGFVCFAENRMWPESACPPIELIMKKLSNRTQGSLVFVCYSIDPQNNRIPGPGRGSILGTSGTSGTSIICQNECLFSSKSLPHRYFYMKNLCWKDNCSYLFCHWHCLPHSLSRRCHHQPAPFVLRNSVIRSCSF